jgi:hypothetical protein
MTDLQQLKEIEKVKIRLVTEDDWVFVAKCSCGWRAEYREYDDELRKHHDTNCKYKGTVGQVGNSRSYKKIDKNLNTLVGANGEIYIITLPKQ